MYWCLCFQHVQIMNHFTQSNLHKLVTRWSEHTSFSFCGQLFFQGLSCFGDIICSRHLIAFVILLLLFYCCFECSTPVLFPLYNPEHLFMVFRVPVTVSCSLEVWILARGLYYFIVRLTLCKMKSLVPVFTAFEWEVLVFGSCIFFLLLAVAVVIVVVVPVVVFPLFPFMPPSVFLFSFLHFLFDC